MPSMTQTLAGIGMSAVILAGGAYMASQLPGLSEYVVNYDQGSASTHNTSSNSAEETLAPANPQPETAVNALTLTITDIKRP